MGGVSDEFDTRTYAARWTSVSIAAMALVWLGFALVMYSDAGTPFIESSWILLWLAGLILVPVTVAGLVVLGLAHRRRPQRWWWLGAFAPPIALLVWFAAIATDVPFRVRLALSEAALADFAETHAQTDERPKLPRRVGLFTVEEFGVAEGCARFITDDSFLDHAGIVYCPDGDRPPLVGEDSYFHIHGDWWRWHRSW